MQVFFLMASGKLNRDKPTENVRMAPTKKAKRKSPAVKSPTAKSVRIRIDVQDGTPSYYVNHFEVGHSQFEFALNAVRTPTILSQAVKNEAAMTGELVLEPELQLLFSPRTAKALIGVLQGQVAAYEANFGPANEKVVSK